MTDFYFMTASANPRASQAQFEAFALDPLGDDSMALMTDPGPVTEEPVDEDDPEVGTERALRVSDGVSILRTGPANSAIIYTVRLAGAAAALDGRPSKIRAGFKNKTASARRIDRGTRSGTVTTRARDNIILVGDPDTGEWPDDRLLPVRFPD